MLTGQRWKATACIFLPSIDCIALLYWCGTQRPATTLAHLQCYLTESRCCLVAGNTVWSHMACDFP